MQTQHEAQQGGRRPAIEITVDARTVTLEDSQTTPNHILALVGLDPAIHYLVRVEGRSQRSFEGKGELTIHVHPGEKFVSVSTGPTPVS